jgi:hypothetical protein
MTKRNTILSSANIQTNGLMNHSTSSTIVWLDRLWVLALLVVLIAGLLLLRSGQSCAYLGTDFRGYYAAAQIARQRGFDQVYDQAIQEEYQSTLLMKCPGAPAWAPLLPVYMPYLPVYVLVVLPLTYLDYSTSYLLWVLLNLLGLLAYLLYFSRSMGVKANLKRSLQWSLCVPLLSNLALGQMNVFLVIFVGEFILAYSRGRQTLSGFWLAAMLMKPHTLVILLPGLVISQNWRVLYGFSTGALIVLVSSIFIGGVDGVGASIQMATQFAGPLIQTAPSMMNFRALALNLESVGLDRFAWAIAIFGMALSSGLVFYLWRQKAPVKGISFILLTVATLAATFAVTWHSHFYLLMILLPALLYLDSNGCIPLSGRWVWIAGPPLLYLLLYLFHPATAREGFGLGMLALNLGLLVWAANKQFHKEDFVIA